MSSAIADSEILVTGASGFVGGHLVRSLTRMGGRIRVLARSTSRLDHIRDTDFSLFEGDLTDPISLARAAENVDYVFHVGGLISAPDDQTYIAVNGDGTKNVCAAAKAKAPDLKRFVYVSSMAAAGPGEGRNLITEEMPARPITPYGASKRLGEKWVQQFDFHWTVIRPPAVYGPEDRAVLDLFKLASNHLRVSLGAGGIASVAYIDNLVDGIIKSAIRPEAVENIFYIADDEPLERTELMSLIQQAVDTWSVPLHVPAWGVRFAARIAESAARGFGGVAFFDRHKATDLLTENWACSIDKARTLLDYNPAVDTTTGMTRTAKWYRQAGWI
jgi:nucleoside-diphosphate-sugar epimerase